MSDSSFENYVVYALTASHLTLKCSSGYTCTPVVRRVSSNSYKVFPRLLYSTICLISSAYGHG